VFIIYFASCSAHYLVVSVFIMRGRECSVDLQFNPEIERTARANRKVVRLSKSVPPSAQTRSTSPTPSEPESIPSPKSSTMGELIPSPKSSIMGDQLPRPKLGDYGLANHCCRLTHVFQAANPVAFDIKTSVLNGLMDKQFDGTDSMSPHEQLSHFAETCEFCVPPATVTDDQKKLWLFAFTLTGRAKDWLLTLPSGTIQTFDEKKHLGKYWEKKHEISNFRQGESESLYDAWEQFNLLLKRCPGHEFSDKQYLQIFTEGLTHNNRMFLDASSGGSLRVKTDHEVQTLIENMAQNEYRADSEEKKRGVFGVSDHTAILANQAAMNINAN